MNFIQVRTAKCGELGLNSPQEAPDNETVLTLKERQENPRMAEGKLEEVTKLYRQTPNSKAPHEIATVSSTPVLFYRISTGHCNLFKANIQQRLEVRKNSGCSQ